MTTTIPPAKVKLCLHGVCMTVFLGDRATLEKATEYVDRRVERESGLALTPDERAGVRVKIQQALAETP